MVESIVVMLMIGLVFFALFQYSNLLSARLVLDHAAARAARARTVGLNHWMVQKSARAAAIPVSGKCLTEFTEGTVEDTGVAALLSRVHPGRVWNAALRASPQSARAQLERARIPDYMDSVNGPTANEVLDYERWESMVVDMDEPLSLDGSMPGKISVSVRQDHPLLIAFPALQQGDLRGLLEGDVGFVRLHGRFSIESHYPLYMENMNW
ncbi:MAG: pilus assembly protein [Kiritimatiellaeota bacterium]|nr:pilus assembly protein [Kiritimatiellota bacterium]